MNRRRFLQSASLAGAGLLLPGPLRAFAAGDFTRLTILHTNDVHSHVEPFPENDRKFPGLGGAEARAAIIKRIRKESEHVLLLDAGDIFQGTPYFNFFGGDIEFSLMNEMGYDAATIGNHDFDGGMEVLRDQVKRADFPMLNCNYDFTDTIMEGMTKPYHVFERGKLRIGVFGVGVELDGLVPPKLYGKTTYTDPVAIADQMAGMLKHDLKCDYVILLSHLGYQHSSDKISDIELAGRTADIDLIIGGHTHTFLDSPVSVLNREGNEVLVNQVGWAGVILGRIDVFFHKNFRKKWAFGETVIIDKKSSQI